MRPRLEALAAKYDVIGDVRGRGAMLAVELVTGGGSLEPESGADVRGRRRPATGRA